MGRVVAIVGSRGPWSLYKESACLQVMWAVVGVLEPERIISGGATGVDRWAEECAIKYGIPFTEYTPSSRDWETGYKPRNIEIAEACDILVCLRCKDSETYGSGWTADYAEQIGKKVYRFTIG